MRWKVLPVLLLAAAASAAEAAGQTPRPPARTTAGPRDVRDVYLAFPFPERRADRPILARSARHLATAASRRAALDRALAAGDGTRLDPRNGYLELTLPPDGSADVRTHLVLTYFTLAGGDRLVVMQLKDWAEGEEARPLPDEHYAWTLSGGRFTPRGMGEFLPAIGFADFWAGRAPPRELGGRTLSQLGVLVFEWPQEGTVARVRVSHPFYHLDEADPRRVFFDRMRFSVMELPWDRQRGRFTKGRKITPEEENEDEHDHH